MAASPLAGAPFAKAPRIPGNCGGVDPSPKGVISAAMSMLALIAAPLTGFATWALARLSMDMLAAGGVMDRPNERSSHDRPVPRGGGVAVLAMVLPGWLVLALLVGWGDRVWPVLAAAAALALLSFADDVRGLPPLPRIFGHGAAVALGVLLLPADALLFGGWLPAWADRAFTALAWLWFVNLFNFMDGADGIAGVETVAVAGGLACALPLAAGGGPASLPLVPLAAVLAGAAAGFLVLNWHPARLFLGDVGSVPLGYLLGWLLVWAACADGLWWLALALPLYYWADATSTLLQRAVRGAKLWQAHREHAYQAAILAGAGHGRVACHIALLNLVLVALTLAAAAGLFAPPAMLAAAAAAVAVALWHLRRRLGRREGAAR